MSLTRSEAAHEVLRVFEDAKRRVQAASDLGQVEVRIPVEHAQVLLEMCGPGEEIMRERASVAAAAAAAKVVPDLPQEHIDALLDEQWPFTEARHGNRRTAARLNPLRRVGLVEIEHAPTTRTWKLSLVGDAAVRILHEHRGRSEG